MDDPTKWVDEWPLPDLSPTDRTKIKSQLWKAHAVYHRLNRDDPYGFISPMEQVFGGIASILFDSNLLTVEILRNQLRLFVIESASAGGWIYFAVFPDQERTEIFPGYLGNAINWERFEGMYSLFEGSIADWLSKLLDSTLTNTPQATPNHHNRKTLADAYFARFPTVKVLDVCWAAGQHYSEWKRWKRDALKAESSPDRAFRAFLTSGQLPKDYRRQPRPKGWK
jgi:hypothetical protein